MVITPTFAKMMEGKSDVEVELVPLESGNIRASLSMQHSNEPERERSQLKMSSSRDVMCDSAIMLQQLVNFVPFPIIQSLPSEFNHLAELRLVSTMFMKWDSYDTKKHRDLMTLQGLFEDAQEILAAAGAFTRQFLVDDKGCVLIACWGVPTASYIDNSFRALRTAVELRNAFLAHDFQASFGITTGTVYCGTIGSYIRREYAAIGDVVNLSARLMSKADGSILIDQATFTSLPTKSVRKLKKLHPIVVKGKTEPIQIYEYSSRQMLAAETLSATDYMIREKHKNLLLHELDYFIAPGLFTRKKSQQSSRKYRGSFSLSPGPKSLGRQTSLSRLFGGGAADATCRVLLVQGKMCTGKSSLVRWYRDEIEKRNIAHKSIALTASDRTYEYRTISKIFFQMVGEGILDSIVAQKRVVMELLNAIYPPGNGNFSIERKQMLSAMQVALSISTGVSLQEATNNRSVLNRMRSLHASSQNMKSHNAEIQNALELILLELFRSENMIFCIEHIHFADSESLKVLSVIQRLVSKSIFVFTGVLVEESQSPSPKSYFSSASATTHRGLLDEELTDYRAFHALLTSHPRTEVITLTPFVEADIEAILGSVLHQTMVPRDLLQLISRMSKGNAFWVREMIDFVQTIGPAKFMATMNEKDDEDRAMGEGDEDDERDDSAMLSPNVKKSVPKELREDNDSDTFSTPLSRIREADSRTTATQGKSRLQMLTICRFELLDSDEQQLLKVASVFGMHAETAILCNVLSQRLKSKMMNIISSLVDSHWLLHDDTSPEGSPAFEFTHELPRRTIYDLIPSSNRITLHQRIVEVILESKKDEMDAKTFLALTSHYRNFDDFKALEMSCAAANRYISNVNSEYSECCQVLKNSIRYFSSVVDCEVVLKLVARARHAVYIQVIIDEELKSLAFGDTQVKPPPTVGCFGSFSFFTGSKYRVSPVEVANGKKGKPSKLSAQSTITRQGVQSITERLRVLELKLNALRQQVQEQNQERQRKGHRKLE